MQDDGNERADQDLAEARAGVAQYAASPPQTAAITGAATAAATASVPTSTTRRRRPVRSTSTMASGHTQ